MDHRPQELFQRDEWIERSEEEARPCAQRHLGQIVRRGGEPDDTLEFGHADEFPAQLEPPAMIPAAEVPLRPQPLANEVPPVGADVGQAVQPILVVPRQQQRLIDRALQQRGRVDVARRLDDLRIRHELPRSPKRPPLHRRQHLRIGIKPSRRRPRLANVRVDVEVGHGK